MQINNLKIKYSKLYNKYQVISLNNKIVFEEFDTEEQAIKYAKSTKDFINKKQEDLEENQRYFETIETELIQEV